MTLALAVSRLLHHVKPPERISVSDSTMLLYYIDTLKRELFDTKAFFEREGSCLLAWMSYSSTFWCQS